MLAFGKANASGNLKGTVWGHLRYYSGSSATAPKSKPVNRNDDAAVQRELFVNILNANATKRDAKQYLARFKPAKPSSHGEAPNSLSIQSERNARNSRNRDSSARTGVNLGVLYGPARAIAESPQFTHQEDIKHQSDILQEEHLHVALVSLRAPEAIDDITLDGLAATLAQLVKLDMRIILILGSESLNNLEEHHESAAMDATAYQHMSKQQADRICEAISGHSPEGGRLVAGALEVPEFLHSAKFASMEVNLALPKLILEPLKRGIVPVVPLLAHTTSGQLTRVKTTDVVMALTKHFCGLEDIANSKNTKHRSTTSLDRIIVLDEIGGIPSKARGDGAHVFINLEQEFGEITSELLQYALDTNQAVLNPGTVFNQHQANLDMVRRCLVLLPSTSSALLITPQEAASSSITPNEKEVTIGTGTRRQKNTLIHNLLTNKPMISSSLPAARLPSPVHGQGSVTPAAVSAATLVKRGMPVTIVPDASRARGWQFLTKDKSTLRLEEDPRVDFPRLLHLIEDSFRRKLDVSHYLARIENRIAGIIVAGEYEGGAILTWEMPPNTNDPARLVPYLDKFAVLQSSQGSSGVADVVFQSMVRTCFPHGVCWRSRQDNPVNKWYFERATGTWQIPESNWTMFWTGEGVVEDEQKWNDYIGVCRGVLPSWADGKKPD